jgi:8-hydroxy-5-deazaflavin:NADPH oxidoreductase
VCLLWGWRTPSRVDPVEIGSVVECGRTCRWKGAGRREAQWLDTPATYVEFKQNVPVDDNRRNVTVAVLGAGIVGRTLATGWARAGHRVLLGSRTPDAPRVLAAVAETGAAGAARHSDATRHADVAVITTPADQVPALVAELGDTLAGRVAIDTTNLVSPGAAVLHHIDALVAAGAVAFRGINTTGWEQMARPLFGTQRADMPFAGPDTPARPVVEQLIADLGFRPVWLGEGPEALASTDALARLWFQLAFSRGWGRRLGLRLLTAADDPDDPRPAAS